MTHFVRKPSNATIAAAMDTLLRACGHTVVVKPKPKRTPFNRFDAEPKRAACERATHRAALYRVTGMRA